MHPARSSAPRPSPAYRCHPCKRVGNSPSASPCRCFSAGQPLAMTCQHDERTWRKSTAQRPIAAATRPRLTAHPADELLDLDPVETPDDAVAAQAKHRDALTIEVFPLAPRSRIAVDRPIFELDPHLVQQVDHRGRLTRPVGAIK